jgi:3'-5' exoribonuclease
MNAYTDKKEDNLNFLTKTARQLGIYDLSKYVLECPHFAVWSGAGKKHQHHYGECGLLQHTREVVELCLENAKFFASLYKIRVRELYLSSLWHDYGKVFDYYRYNSSCGDYEFDKSEHARKIHHVSRSAIEWNIAALKVTDDKVLIDAVTHNILSHHGQREWGSPVAPYTREAWLLHLCDAISARMDDALKMDIIKQ